MLDVPICCCRFTLARSRPPVDMEQNLECTKVTRDGGRVTMCYKRKKVTGDDRDLSLDECRNFLHAWGGRFGNNPPESFRRHQMRNAPREKICPPSPETCPGPSECRRIMHSAMKVVYIL